MKISIIIPVYNASDFLEKTVASALDQVETGEIILVEDGSIDNSLQLCQKLQSTFPNVRLFQHEDKGNHGPGKSRNLGIEKANFRYVSFLDADDFYLPNRFKTTREIFDQKKKIDGVYDRMDMHFESEAAQQKFVKHFKDFNSFSTANNIPPDQLLEALVLNPNNNISICGTTIRKDFLIENKIMFLEHIKTWEDTHFLFECYSKGIFYGGRQESPAVMRRVHLNNISYNRKMVREDSAIFFGIWLKKMLENNFSKQVNRYFLRRYLSERPIITKVEHIAIIRIIIKSYYFMQLLIFYPKIFRKIF